MPLKSHGRLAQEPARTLPTPGQPAAPALPPPQPMTGLRVFLPHTVNLHLRRHHSFDVSQLPNPPITPPPTGLSIFSGGGQRGLGCCQRTSWDRHATKAAESAMTPEEPTALRVPVCDMDITPLPHGACGPMKRPLVPCEDRAVGGPLPRCHDPSPALELGPGSTSLCPSGALPSEIPGRHFPCKCLAAP